MVTTIQVNERTLMILKKLRDELHAQSYDEAINKIVIERANKKSMAGYLGKRYGKMSRKEILEELRDKHDRF